jgi:hypothetical protein
MSKKKRDQCGKNRRRMRGSFKLNCVGTESEGVDWIHLAQEWRYFRVLLYTIMNHSKILCMSCLRQHLVPSLEGPFSMESSSLYY